MQETLQHPPSVLERSAPRAISILALALAVSLAYWPATRSLSEQWTRHPGPYHWTGWIVAALSAWFLLRRQDAIALARPQPNLSSAFLLALAGLAWLLAYCAHVELVQQVLLPLIMGLAISAVWGGEIARELVVPLSYLVLGIPIWDVLVAPLQFLTVHVSGSMLALIGLSIHIRGNLVQIPEGTFEIEGGCAGLGYLLVGLILAGLYGELERVRATTRLLLIAVGAVIALASNWVRVTGVVLIGHFTHMQSPIVRDHRAFGWWVFAFGMLLFALIARRLCAAVSTGSSDRIRRAPAREKGGSVNGQSHLASEPRSPTTLAARHISRRTHVGGTAMAVLVGAGVWPIWAAAVQARHPPPMTSPLLKVMSTLRWAGPATPMTGWKPFFQGATLEQMGAYVRMDTAGLRREEVDVYVAAYAKQSQKAKLLGYFNTVLGSSTLSVERQARIAASGREMNELEVREPSTSRGQFRRWIVWYAYQIGPHTFASGAAAQFWYAMESLVSKPTSRVIALRATCGGSCSQTRALVGRFVEENPWLFEPH